MTGTVASRLSHAEVEAPQDDGPSPAEGPRERLLHAIHQAAEFLPAQGPIRVFIHHNTLHAFEDLPFDDGVRAGAELFGCEPYLPESRYRERFEAGRIRVEDVSAVLRDDLGPGADEQVLMFGRRFDIRMAMMRFPLWQATGNELQWFMAETDALRTFRQETPYAVRQKTIRETMRWIRQLSANGHTLSPEQRKIEVPGVIAELLKEHSTQAVDVWDVAKQEAFTLSALWRICRHGIHTVQEPSPRPKPPLRHRDALLRAVGHDSDLLINEVLIRFCAAFLDQGFSQWTLPLRDRGFAAAFAGVYLAASHTPERWRAGIRGRLAEFQSPDFDPVASVNESLDRLGVAESDWQAYVTAKFLSLRGWAGMIRQVELRADSVARPIPPGSLIEYLAVRLALDCAALEFLAKEHLGFTGPLSELKAACQKREHKPPQDRFDQRAFVLFQLAQLLGWLPKELVGLNRADWSALIHEVESFTGLERRRTYHQAFERNYRIQVLDALAFRSRIGKLSAPTPACQVVCCLDEREESFRRHMEEVSPEMETYSAAGFFNVPMYYRGIADAHFVPLCPIVIRPQHWVREKVHESEHEAHTRQQSALRLFGLTLNELQQKSQTFWGGAVIASVLGALATFPLLTRVLFPRIAAKLRDSAGLWVLPRNTRLKLQRTDPEPSTAEPGIGFTVDEMAASGVRMLSDIGLTSNFAPLVLIVGHGSSSVNNPHKSAYDCGACGGNAGGPNARATAQLLNLPEVRAKLAEKGIVIPETTYFVGAYHNTCNDVVTLYDLDLVPPSHAERLEHLRGILDETCRRNAHERTRRFLSADLQASFAAAHLHVEGRSEDLAQARPECGHASNAVCFVGRRARTRGLYMDRRTFLTSYDPTSDDADATILSRILAAAVPVCAGINLEYYFSYVDTTGWGCGTKLPHNVTGMVGVMDGMASDLRPGLPWQMVEIHEPVRLLFVLETPFNTLLKLFQQVPVLEQLTRNGWIQLAALDPHSEKIVVYERGEFRPYVPEAQLIPRAASSWEWYRGWRDNLGFALID